LIVSGERDPVIQPERAARLASLLQRSGYSTASPPRLVALKVDVLVAINRLDALAAQRATSTIPIIFVYVSDPVGSKLVVSLAHPGGNITGLSNFAGRIAVCDLFAAACRETRSCRENYHLYVPTDQPRRSLVIDNEIPETGTYSNKNRETIAEKRAITMRD
jgi:hypothetical protein